MLAAGVAGAFGGRRMELRQDVIEPAGDLTPVRHLNNAEKAAVIVRLLISEGAVPRLTGLSQRQQERLVEHMATLAHVDRPTLAAIVLEFARSLDNIGLIFPRDMSGALELLETHLSDDARARLRNRAEAEGPPDPWRKLAAMEPDRLAPLVTRESAEICAIMLAKLPVSKAAAILADLPADRAHIVAHAVSVTGAVDPATIARVGDQLLAELNAQPSPAFGGNPADRVGAILNAATAETRDRVLDGLDARDAGFAGDVRRAIFTFEHIPKRLESKDVPKAMRGVDPETTTLALAAGMQAAPVAVEFLLENMSKRMAEQLREDAEARGNVHGPEGEAAMAAVVSAIRSLADDGEIRLIAPEDD